MTSACEAVEADLFLQIYESFQNASRRIQIATRNLCAVRKVVWSSFDYMSGPELGFTWEIRTAASETNSSDKSSLSGGSRDGSSVTSSVTRNAEYEDIDDVYRTELLTDAASDTQLCSISTPAQLFCDRCNSVPEMPYDAFKMNALIDGEHLFLDEFMNDSRSTEDGTATVVDAGDDQSKHLVALSSDCAMYKTNSSSSSQATVLACSGLGDVDSLGQNETTTKNAKNTEDSQAMVSSGVDSGIAVTVSVHSDLSTAASITKDMSDTKERVDIIRELSSVDDNCTVTDEKDVEGSAGVDENTFVADEENPVYQALSSLVGDNDAVHLSDEEYVTKFVLAEQICSTPMPSNPVVHKFTLLPKRNLFMGSYLFQAKGSTRPYRAMYAISLLGDLSRWDWYIERQNVIEEIFIDMIPRLRISYMTESLEDFVCRATKEISGLLSVLGVCEFYPLLPRTLDHDIRLRQTYFGDKNLQNNTFLAKSITAVFLSQSHCIVVGDEKDAVVRMLMTLYLFVAPELRWLCITPYQHSYSPYLRLQAVKRSELFNIMYAGVESHWPLTLIDLDRRIVCTSLPYSKHRSLKLIKQKTDITQILKGNGVDNFNDSNMPKIDLRNCHADPRVRDFLIKMDLLPFESNARMGFIRQFRLIIENSARALIAYVQDISEPDASYKQHAASSKWSLWSARKSLDLTNNSSFLVTLAEAERILPDFADFVFESKTT